jgi:23S rRNA-/tRNA-specific pseudouridylate synthase
MPTILYRDEHLVAVHKPCDLLVHRSPLDRHETRFALQLVRDLTGRRVYPVHRLDKGHSSEEVTVPFSEVQEVQLKHKDA